MRKMILILLCIGLLSLPLSAMAASEAEKQTAINAGLAYLASTQNLDGSWTYSGYEPAATGAALLSFVEQKYKPLGWNGADYSGVVAKATEYLLKNAQNVDISAGAFWGNSSNDGSNKGIQWGQGTGENTYISGLVLPALARLTAGIVNPGDVITSTNAVVNGLTYQQVIQRTVDMFEWGQNGLAAGNKAGGWRYTPRTGDSDNSTAQWPVISMLFAQNVPGVSVAPQVKTELIKWINYIQNTISGGSGYDTPTNLVNEAKTGGLLIEMAFAAGGGDKAKALAYLDTNWKNTPNATWNGNFGHPYAMWSIYKGLASTIGLDDMGTITNLHSNPGDVDNPNHGWNWWEDYCQWLVDNQQGGGSWSGYESWVGALSTAWNINILNATEIPDGGGAVPEPATMILLGSGLVGLAGYARKRMKK